LLLCFCMHAHTHIPFTHTSPNAIIIHSCYVESLDVLAYTLGYMCQYINCLALPWIYVDSVTCAYIYVNAIHIALHYTIRHTQTWWHTQRLQNWYVIFDQVAFSCLIFLFLKVKKMIIFMATSGGGIKVAILLSNYS